MNADQVIKVSIEGVDIRKAKPYEFAINSAYDSPKVDLRKDPGHYGTVNVLFSADITGTAGTYIYRKLTTINHKLGFVPMFFLTGLVLTPISSLTPTSGLFVLPATPLGTTEYTFYGKPLGNDLEIWLRVQVPVPAAHKSIAGVNLQFRYFIFSQNLLP